MKVHNCDFGSINYRLPRVDDVLMTMHFMGVDANKAGDKGYMQENQMYFMANLIKKMDYFIESFDIKVEGKVLDKYEDLLKDLRFMNPLMAVAGEIVEALNLSDVEKK